MRFRALLNILISYVLLFPAGVTNLGADTISHPVSIAVPTSINGEMDSKPVSVAVPTGVNGEMDSKPVSVAIPEGMYGSMSTKPVSVSYAVTAADGTYMGRPATVAVNPENQGDPDLVGMWHLDGDGGDSSGNNNNLTSVNGASFSSDKKIGTQAASFNGSNTYLRASSGNNMPRGNSPRTFMAWIKPYSYPDGTYNGIFAYGQMICTGKGSLLSIKNDGRLSTAFWCNDASQTTGPAASLNSWNHVAVTYDGGTTVKFYMNGQFVQESAVSAGTAANTQDGPIRIGSTDDPGRVFNGLIDEVAVYKRALTAEEIAFFANAAPGDPAAPPAPVLNPVPSVVGTNTIALSGAKTIGTSIWVNNKKIAPLDNTETWQGTYGTLQPGTNILNVIAVDATSKQSLPVSKSVIYDNMPPVIESSYPANNSDTAKPVPSIIINLTDTYSGINLDESMVGATVKNSAGQTVSGAWAKSGAKAIIFTPITTLPSDSYLVTIYPVDAVGNKGQQQIAFTNHDISAPATKVSVSETKGKDGWYYSTVTVTLTASDGGEGSGIARTEYSFDATSWVTYTASFALDKDGVNTLYYRSTDKSGNIEATKSSEIKINKTSLVGLWHMDNNWQDSSVVGNHAALSSNATFSSNAKIGTYAGSFNGSNSSVTIPDAPTLHPDRNITVLGWIYLNAFDKTWQNIVWKGNTPDCTTNCENREYTLWLNSNGSLHLASTPEDRVGVGQLAISSPTGVIKTAAAMPANNGWHHFAAVISSDQNIMKIYVNGVEQAGGAYSSTDIRDTSGPLYIGSNPSWNSTFNGLIDELTIYKRVLSPTEIQENYRSYSIQPPTVNPVQTPTTTATLTLSGTKAANTAVVVNGTTVASLDNQTTWQGTYTLQPGMNTLNVTAMDADGFHSQAVVVSVALDLTAPTVTSTDPVNNGLFNTSVGSITFNLNEPFSAIDLDATLTGASVTKTSGADPSGSWTTSGSGPTATITFTPAFSLGEGTYTATINPTDTLGNRSTYSITFTVDATPPQPPTIDPILVSTRTTTKTITGTKSLDSVRVVVGCAGATVGTVSYPTSLTWSVTVSGLREGSNTVTAYAVDAATNASSSTEMTFVVDTIAPAPPVVNPPVTPTKQSSIALTGTKEAGSYLFVNNFKAQAAYADTTWSYGVNLASEGNNAFVVFAQDEAGNPSQSVTVNVVRDTTAPRILSTTPPINGYVNQLASIDIALIDDNSGVDLQASITNNEVKHSSGAVINGSWTTQDSGHIIFTPAAGTVLNDGLYTVTIKSVDALGNTITLTFSFTLDTALPTVQSLTMNPTSPHKAETVTFIVTFNEDMLTSVQPVLSFTRGLLYSTYAIPSGTWTSSKTWQGPYTFTTNNGDGTYTVKITGAKDKSGNAMNDRSMPDAFVLDTTASFAPGLDPVTTPTNIRNQILKGTKEAGSAIFMNGSQKVSADANTTWSYNYPLVENSNTLNITARDAAGNDSVSTTATIMLDTTPPAFIVNTYQNPSPVATQTLTGAKEPGCIVKLNNIQIFGTTDTSQTWSYTLSLVSGITNHFVFTAADALGNIATKAIDILYDNAPPAPLGPGVLVADGSGKGNELTLTWAAYPETTDVAYYAVYRSLTAFSDVTGMTPIGTVNKGVKTYKATGLTQGTTYYFAVVPVDLAGNQVNTVNIASAAPADTMAPEEVTNLSATAGYTSAQSNFITLTWSPSANTMGDLADQIVYADGGTGYDAGTPLGKTVTTYTKPGLSDATKYKFKITVKDTLGHESLGAVVEAVTRLNNPANLSAAPASGKVTLTWSAVSSSYVKQYNIYRKTTTVQQVDISAMSLIGTVAKTSTTYTDTGLVNDTTYQYAVTVMNTSGAERTDVQGISATPRSDSTGPVIDTFNIIAGQVVTGPITISATAHDVESAMGSMEISVDGTVIATQAGGSISAFWNVVAATDGNHTVKVRALDSRGNATEDPRQVIVSLAPPAIPAITGHIVSQTTPTYLVKVSGTAPLFTIVTLRVNGLVIGQTQTAGTTGTTGTFSFSSVALIEGDNLLAAKASHRGGESAYTPDYKILVDTGAPPAPQNLASQVLPGGLLRFTWANGTGEIPASYNLYVSSSTFSSRTAAGVSKANTSAITYQYNEYNPGYDSLKYYAVTAVDSAGNESGISNVVSVSSDRVPPSIADIQYTQSSAAIAPNSAVGIGDVKVSITVSEPLKELPFFSLEPVEGTPIVVSMTRVDDTHYAGTFAITAQSPQGTTTYKFSGKDMVGNRGNAQGTGITIDVKGPEAAVQAPLTTLQIKPDPVTVALVLNEPSVTTPTLTLKAADGTSALVSGMTSTDNGIHWTGSLNVSGMPEGKAEFIMSGAQDKLGNIGTTVSTGRYILLYLNQAPPPGIPDGLAAKPEKAGAVTLTWYPVVYAPQNNVGGVPITYNIYRRAETEVTPTKVKTGIAGSPAQDIPPADGIYYYSVTSVGLMGSESPASAEVQAVSDRTGPPAPANLTLSFGSSGVTAVWDAVVDVNSALGTPNSPLPLKGYHLYRSDASFTSSAGLAPVARTPIATAVDTSPSKTYRFYAVAAVDSLGNEGPLSAVKEIDFPVSPVRNLVLQRIDDAAPTITWQAPQDGAIAGYHIYRNGSRITPYPVPNVSYTDGYAVINTTYGVSAIDNLGNESPVKQVTLPELFLGLKNGTTLRRGLLETLQLILTSGQGSGFTIDSLDVRVGTAPASSILGPFVLGANTTLQLEKIAATTADALSPVSVFIQANWSPSPGVTINVSRTTAADVLGSSSSLEIFNDPLVRNTDAKVRLKVNNIGTAQMEVVTSENNARTTKVRVNLKDQDGNLLSTGYLDQRIGSSIVNGAGYAVARINPNESFLTDPITLAVPASAPYKVIIEAVIENTYYHYAKPDQVAAPGIKGTADSTIQETPYRAVAAPEKTFYATAQPVIITGSAISNDPSLNGQLVPNVPVRLGISVRGFDRFYTVTTDATGRFSYTFVPGNEAGDYSLWAVHPDVKDRTVQATFSIAGLAISPSTATVRIAKNRTLDVPVTLNNYGGGNLTGLLFETAASSGITAGVINSGDTLLTAGENQAVTLRISAAATAPDTGWATLKATTAEGLSVTLNASITVASLIPVISASPSYIDTGMVRGDQKLASFNIINSGEDTLRNARIGGPSTSWMSLAQGKTIGDIAPGASVSVSFMFSPPSTLAQGVYDDQVVIYSDNHVPYTYHIQVTVTSSAVGSVYFDVMNELMAKVPNATITFQHQLLTELLYTVRTGADGTFMQNDIPEGRYVFNVSAPGTKAFSGSFVISPGITTTVPIALEVTLVQVEWSVTPVVIQDRYEITVTQTFQTNVPTPVLVSEPANITIPELKPGEVFNGEYTVTNYGLIALNDVSIQFPKSFGEYDIEILATLPKTISAMQRVTVPYRITRRITAAWLEKTALYASNALLDTRNLRLFDEVSGYGGLCYDGFGVTVSGSATICAGALNARTVNKSSTYTVSTPIPGSSCGATGGGGTSPVPTYGGYGGSGGGSQGGGGGLPGGTGPIATLPGDTGCVQPRCSDGGCDPCHDKNECDCCLNPGSSLDPAGGTYTFAETDLKLPAPSIPIEWTRTYRSNQLMKAGDKWQFAVPMGSPLGYGWHSPWFARAGDGSYLDGEGNYYVFAKDSTGKYLPHANGLILTKTATGYEVGKRGENTSVFNSKGMLSAIRDRRSNLLTLIYDSSDRLISVNDVTKRNVLAFTYNAGNHIETATDIAGRTLGYEYDTYGNMTKATLTVPGAQPVILNTYSYDTTAYPVPPVSCYYGTASGLICENNQCYQGTTSGYICETGLNENMQNNYHNLISKTNTAGETYTLAYVAQWRNKGIVDSITDPAGRTMKMNYGFGSGTYYSDDYSGRRYKRILNDKGELTYLAELDAGGGEQLVKKIEYLPGRIINTTDALGNVTSIQKDEWGNIIKKIDAAGNSTTYTYTVEGRLQDVTDALGTITKYEYDQYGNKTKEILAAGTSDESATTYTYDQYNQLTSVTKGLATTSYEYDAAGNLTKITDPMGNATTMTYDALGNLGIRTLPIIGDTRYEAYDYNGKPGKITDVNGNVTSYTYDIAGRVKTVTTEVDAATTQYFYVPNAACGTGTCGSSSPGKIDHIILPEGNTISYGYDTNGNMIRIADTDGNSINYSYDKNNNKTREEIKDNKGVLQKTLSYQYDLLNRQTKIVNPDNTFTENGYDSRGNKVSAKNPNGNTTMYQYDTVNRLVETIQPGNITTAYIYDHRNNLTSVIDANGNRTSYEYDKQNRVTKTISPDTGTTTYSYDLNGNLMFNTDAKGAMITYVYDALNRLTTVDFPTDTDLVYAYDNCLNGKGRLCKMTDASGATTYEYTPKGQVKKETKVIDGITYITQYTYDKDGNIKAMIYPSGRVITYNYSNNKVVSVLNNADALATNVAYKPFGGMNSITYGNGATRTISYDDQYRIIDVNVAHPASGNIMHLSYSQYDANGNIMTINDVVDPARNRSFTYDALDRLTTANGNWGTLGWTYDGVGNRQSETNGNVSSYAYETGTNKLTGITSATSSSFIFDKNGNTVAENSRDFVYNQNQRLIRVLDAGITKGEYTYNGNGQRVKKDVTGTLTIFHYNLAGQIIAESSSTGILYVDYVYLNRQPLAKIESANAYYYHNDHLATPQKITDLTGAVVWSADYKPFGEATITVATILNNLRFPGQYFDIETGLHYNYFRDYNPVVGRYIQSDPIGTKDGKNHLYAYVLNNPLRGIDPQGLEPQKGPQKDPTCVSRCLSYCAGETAYCMFWALYFPVCEVVCVFITKNALVCTVICGAMTLYEIGKCFKEEKKCADNCINKCPDAPDTACNLRQHRST